MYIPDDAKFYEVIDGIDAAPLRQYREHGYDTRDDFRDALRQIVQLWKGRVGECIGERHEFRHLRFHDTPGGRPDEAWIPDYLMRATEMPEWIRKALEPVDPIEREIEEALGLIDDD